MSDENNKKDVELRDRDIDNIIMRKLKEVAKEIGYGSYDAKITIHDGQIRSAEISNRIEKVRV